MGNRCEIHDEIHRLAAHGNIGAEAVAEQSVDRHVALCPTADAAQSELDSLSRRLGGFAASEPKLAPFLGRIEDYIRLLRDGFRQGGAAAADLDAPDAGSAAPGGCQA